MGSTFFSSGSLRSQHPKNCLALEVLPAIAGTAAGVKLATVRGAASWFGFFAMLMRFIVQGQYDTPPEEPRAEAVIIRKKRNPYIPQAGRYKSTDWFANLWSLPTSSLLRRIKGPILCNTTVAMLVCAVHWALEPVGLFPALTLTGHTLLGSALGLLLVFRTNTAYSRFWEGRVIWEKLLDSGRDLARYAVIFRRQMGGGSSARVCRLVQAFPYCMIEHLRGKADKRLRAKLDRLVGDSSVVVEGDLPLSTNRPLYIVNRLAATIAEVPNEEGPQAMFTNRERCMMLGIVQTLCNTIGACERIVQTPVPLTYVRHTSRFLSIFMFTLPYALVDHLGAISVAVTLVASWALFGILEIGLMIEDPFQRVLKLEVVADTLERDIVETIRFLGANELLAASGMNSVEPLVVHSWAESPTGWASTGGASPNTSKANASTEAPAPVQRTTLTDPERVKMKMKKKVSPIEAEDIALKAFPGVDTDADGLISFEEFRSALQSVDPVRWKDNRLKQVFDVADANADGTISSEEWQSIIQGAADLLRVSGMPSSQPLPADLNDDPDGREDEEDEEDGNAHEEDEEDQDEGAKDSDGEEASNDGQAEPSGAKAANPPTAAKASKKASKKEPPSEAPPSPDELAAEAAAVVDAAAALAKAESEAARKLLSQKPQEKDPLLPLPAISSSDG